MCKTLALQKFLSSTGEKPVIKRTGYTYGFQRLNIRTSLTVPRSDVGQAQHKGRHGDPGKPPAEDQA